LPAGFAPPAGFLVLEREVVRFLALLRAGFFAAPLVAALAGVEALARVAVDLRAPPLFAAVRFAVLRFAVERFAVERLAAGLRAAEPPELVVALALPSIDHLPDITRCAASATASAISEPNLVALAIMLVAAWLAVSAASRPASRIARRAFGLALIAAAAAARPAASISLLIAALAILSTVSLRDEELEELLLEDLARVGLAMTSSPSVSAKRHFTAVTVPERSRK